MLINPIQPDKYYDERVNNGDRLVDRIDSDTLWVVHFVSHDEFVATAARSLAAFEARATPRFRIGRATVQLEMSPLATTPA